MKKIVIIPNHNKDTDFRITEKVIDKLVSLDASAYIAAELSNGLSGATPYVDFPNDAELIIVIGGDGSILDASVLALEYDIPILGVNLGRLGYLSEIEPDNLDELSKITSGEYKINEMMLLTTERISGEKRVKSQRYAVNDVIISHNDFLGIAEFTLENSRAEAVKYRADGVILSTPQGSTAYSLSAGGPIVSNAIDSIVATPICPHSFFNRSIIFSPDEKLVLKNDGKAELNISIDGRFFENLDMGDYCVIKMAEKRLKILSFKDNNMFSTLFRKMRILEDIK